jgi:hypothetical protein
MKVLQRLWTALVDITVVKGPVLIGVYVLLVLIQT